MHLDQLQNFVLVILTKESAGFHDLEPKGGMPPPPPYNKIQFYGTEN